MCCEPLHSPVDMMTKLLAVANVSDLYTEVASAHVSEL